MSALLLSLLSSCLIFSVSRASAYICLSNGKQQKLSPSVEPGLRKCQQYSSNACCSSDHFHAEPVSPFPWDQCGPLSSRCEAQISKVECMYLCSPDIAAWHNHESNSGIKELPLCNEFCDQWFEACKDDLICPGNHAANANCSQDCISYRQAFAAGSQLCDEIWGNTFRTGNKPNPCIEPQSIGAALFHEEPVSEYPNTQEGPSWSLENQPSLSRERVKRAMPEEVIAADLDNTLEGPSGLSEFPNIPARERLRRDIYVNPIAEDMDNSQEGPSGSTDLPNVLPSDRKRRDLQSRRVFTDNSNAYLDNTQEGPSGSLELHKVLRKDRRKRALEDHSATYLDNNQDGPSGSLEPQNAPSKDRTKRSNNVDPTAADPDNTEDGASGSSALQNLLPKLRARRALRERSVFLEEVEGSGSSI